MSAVLKSFLDTTFELTIVKAKLMELDTVRVLQGVLDNAIDQRGRPYIPGIVCCVSAISGG